MALETDDDRAQYATNATTGPFTVPFYFLANEDIAVTYTDSAGTDFALILDVDYTVTGANDPAGGTITTAVAYPSGGKLTILRDLAFIQPVVYEDGDPFPAKTHERALDRNMMASQELREKMTRVLQFSPSDTNSPVLPSALARANTVLGFSDVGDIVPYIPASGSAADVIIQLAASFGSTLVGFLQTGIGAVMRRVQDELREVFKPTQFGVVPNWNGTTGTDNASTLQTYFARCEQLSKVAAIPTGFYLTGPVTLGDPATAANRSGSNQGRGVYGLTGTHKFMCTFYASAAATDLVLFTRNNLAGTYWANFGIDGRGLAAVGLDLSWTGVVGSAPSTSNILENIHITNCKVTGLVVNNLNDSKFSGLHIDSPISVAAMAGGGDMGFSQSKFGGLFQIAAQTGSVVQCELLGGLDINGNTTNQIHVIGGQIFPIGVSVSIPSPKSGYAIAADDSGTFGASLVLDSTYVLGGNVGCIRGKFNFGISARNTTFIWGAGAVFFGPMSTGSSVPPVYEFTDCNFGGVANGPIDTAPASGWVILRRCFVAGVYVEYYSNRDDRTFSGVITSTGGTQATTYTSQVCKSKKTGNLVTVFFDSVINVKDAGMTGTVKIGGWAPIVAAGFQGGGAVLIAANVTLTAGYTWLTAVPDAGGTTATIFMNGSAVAPTPLPAANIANGTHLSAVLQFGVA